ncbi:MAG: hypothetical protein GY796_14560 [Chloroflexi bacterium]|nr:hypothetical protein [Chloroflexota bacterium]
MRTFKRVVAWIVVVLSVVGIVAVLAGIVGSWIVRNQVTDITVNLLTVGETAAANISGGLNRIDDRLNVSQENIATLEGNITDVGEDLEENSLVGEVISNNISDDLAASITDARATAVSIADTVATLDAAINAVNEIPLINLDGFVATLISDVADGLIQLEDNMAEFRTGVQERREERLSDSVDFLTGITANMSGGINDIQTSLNDIDGRLDETAARFADAKVTLPRTFTLVTLAANMALLLVGLAFVSLLLHSWAVAQNPDITLKELTAVEKTESS